MVAVSATAIGAGAILKSIQGLGEGVVVVDKGQVESLRPNTILRALEESTARR